VWSEWFDALHDPVGLRCEDNVLRYRPLRTVALVIGNDAGCDDVRLARIAADVAGVTVVEDPSAPGVDRVRVIGAVDDQELRRWRASGLDVDLAPVSAVAWSELRHWVREQAVSITRHRHGRPVPRSAWLDGVVSPRR
jgi:RHH-type transcriptional regulator, proline utilization regulon repressor / proline dehydrogenase / delta 1-pyrroline-5-carboxylate dehydrogenase